MKNMKRILVTLVAAVLLMAMTVVGTLAYLNSYAGTVTNTFVVGNVTITLDEGDVYEVAEQTADITDEMLGQHKAADKMPRVTGNEYKLVPAKEYDKDPTVHVAATSEDCYVFVKVVNPLGTIEAAHTDDTPSVAKQMEALGWVALDVDGVDNVFYYNGPLKVANTTGRVVGGTDLVVFNNFYTSTTADVSADPGDFVIEAYAVQAENLADPAAAWAVCPLTNWQ